MKSWKLEAVILAIGMLVMGYFIKQGLDTFSGKDRVVNVKGLAEMEVPANKVTWPLMYKDLGNDLPTLYNKINATNQAIVGFLKQKGITENEISINAPEIIDMQAERYNNNSVPFRYNVTEGGYYYKFLADPSRTFFFYLGGSALAGYESVNRGERRLYDGSTLRHRDRFLYGGAVTLEVDAYLTDRIILSLTGRERILWGTTTGHFHAQFGLGVKFIIH